MEQKDEAVPTPTIDATADEAKLPAPGVSQDDSGDEEETAEDRLISRTYGSPLLLTVPVVHPKYLPRLNHTDVVPEGIANIVLTDIFRRSEKSVVD